MKPHRPALLLDQDVAPRPRPQLHMVRSSPLELPELPRGEVLRLDPLPRPRSRARFAALVALSLIVGAALMAAALIGWRPL